VIIFDASAVTELLVKSPVGLDLTEDLAARDDALIVPHLLDVEVVSALRRMAAGGHIQSSRMDQLLWELSMFPAERYPHLPFLGRIWELRNNFTAYDAVYIALAEATGGVLYTTDEKLCRGHRAKVRHFPSRPDD
jgi:predicted nucleic acid-binding protein